MFLCKSSKQTSLPLACVALLALATAPAAPAQSPAPDTAVDPTLAALIASIPAIDNHAHPMLSPPAFATDRGFDALPVDSMEPQSDPLAFRPESPALGFAWHALYGFDLPAPLGPDQLKLLEARRTEVRAQHGEGYAAWVLDQANIGTMLANRVAMGTGVQRPRFRWVPYADALLFPLDNSGLAAATPDRRQFFPLEDALRTQYLAQVHLKAVPATLDLYLKQVVTPILEQQKANGAIAEKFEVAYLRSFDFSDPAHAQAATVYARFAARGTPPAADYKLLQDFLFRYIAAECGRLALPVHLHTIAGAGGYFSIAGTNPLLLEPIFNDARLRHTNFVLLHGGWPYVHEIGALLQKPNVYLDLSQQSIMLSPRSISGWLREWLAFQPDKVLYATDAYPYSASMGWEEAALIANANLRRALGMALTGMVRDNEITPARAGELARMVLRKNAETLYHF